MTLEVIRRWFSKLPESERDLPIVIYNGIAYSPRAILYEVMRGTKVGKHLQGKVEAGELGTTSQEEYYLALLRLKQILSRYPPNKPILASLTYPPQLYTPQQLINAIERGTPLGKRLVNTEIQHMRYLLSLR